MALDDKLNRWETTLDGERRKGSIRPFELYRTLATGEPLPIVPFSGEGSGDNVPADEGEGHTKPTSNRSLRGGARSGDDEVRL